MPEGTFSERHGFAPAPAEITVRAEAPLELRGVVVDLAYDAGLNPHRMRTLVCGVLMTRADESNWSAFPNVDDEVRRLLDGCEWFEVYDVVEAVIGELAEVHHNVFSPTPRLDSSGSVKFSSKLNEYFVRRGIGWQVLDGRVEVRGPEMFELAVRPTTKRLSEGGLTTASGELREALHDLSRRPDPDLTGAIQHALASLECVAREAVGDKSATLGAILKAHPEMVPAPLASIFHEGR